MMRVVGDIGKSNIRLAVIADGSVLRTVEHTSPAALGQSSDSDTLFLAIAHAFKDLDVSGEVLEVGLGVAGLARFAALGETLAIAIGQVAIAEPIVLTSDIVIAHLSAFGGEEGTVLVVGTGSAALNVEVGHPPVLRDGKGPRFGDDGSGGWLGTRAVRAVLQAAEGRGPETSLVALLAERSSLDSQSMVREGSTVDHPARWAGMFAPDVLLAWQNGDAVATGIVDDAVAALTRTAVAARRSSRAVALTGGLIRHEPFAAELTRSLRNADPELVISISDAPPLQGAQFLLELERATVGSSLQTLVHTYRRAG